MWPHKSFSSDFSFPHLRAWTRFSCAARTWDDTHMHSFLLISQVLFQLFFSHSHPHRCPPYPPPPPRSSSTLSGWLHVAWPQRARLWLTAVSRAKLRAFAPFWLCKRAIPVPMAMRLPVMKVSILTVWCHLAIIRSTRPNRYGRGETHFSIDILLGCRKRLFD